MEGRGCASLAPLITFLIAKVTLGRVGEETILWENIFMARKKIWSTGINDF